MLGCSLLVIQGEAQIAEPTGCISFGRPEPGRAPYIQSIRQRAPRGEFRHESARTAWGRRSRDRLHAVWRW